MRPKPKSRAQNTFSITAKQVMSRPLIVLKTKDTMKHAAALFLDKNISGAPVLNHLDQPVGVLTKTDIVRYEREYVAMTEAFETREAMRTLGTLELIAAGKGFHRETEEDYVSHWMTPKVFAVDQETPLVKILKEMVRRKVHRIFVKDRKTDKLIGVITTFDLMKFLARVLLVVPVCRA